MDYHLKQLWTSGLLLLALLLALTFFLWLQAHRYTTMRLMVEKGTDPLRAGCATGILHESVCLAKLPYGYDVPTEPTPEKESAP